jgi:hypothetical protein
MKPALSICTIILIGFGSVPLPLWAMADTETITAKDVRGSSQLCQTARGETPPTGHRTCRLFTPQEKQQRIKLETESLAFITATESESAKAANELKRELIQNAVANFADSVTSAKRLTGEDPFLTRQVKEAEAEMLKACSGANDFSKDISSLLSKSKMPEKNPTRDLAGLQRYAVAMLEYDRISLLVDDNYLRGDDRARMLQRRKRLLQRYPMVSKGSHASLKQQLGTELRLHGNDSRTPSAQQDWMDAYLFENQDTPSPTGKESLPISYLAAMAMKNTPLSTAVTKEVSIEFMLNTKAALKSLGGLCQSDACSTFNISHALTVSALQRRATLQRIQSRSTDPRSDPTLGQRKFDLLLYGVCNCRMLEPRQAVDDNAVLGAGLISVGALVICGTNFLLPNPTLLMCATGTVSAVAALAMDTANTAVTVYDSRRTSGAAQVSQNLPGLKENEKTKLTEFQKEREMDVASKVALTAATAPALKVATAGVKAGVNKFKDFKGRRTTGSSETPVVERRQRDASTLETGGLRPPTQEFVEIHAAKEATSEAQRLSFDSLVKRIDADLEKWIVFATETSPLREINHHLGKEVGDALGNFHNELLVKKLKQYQQKHPGLLIEMSHSYKGFFHIPHGKVPPGYANDYKKIVSEVYGEMADHLTKNKILRADELALIQRMRNTGEGSTFQEATDSRKLAKEHTPDKTDKSGAMSYSNSTIQESIQTQQFYTDYYRKELVTALGKTPLMESVGAGQLKPTQEVLAYVKSFKDPEELKKAFAKRYPGTKVNDETIKKLKLYNELIEDQNPSQYPLVSRERATLADAEKGGLASDTISMGSYNSDATQIALATADGVADAKRKIRIEEQKVTSRIQNEINPHFKETAKTNFPNSKTAISGDEKVIAFENEPSLASLKDFVKAHAGDPGLQRHSSIPAGVPKEVRNLLVEDGLKIDKVLRKELLINTSLPFEKTGSINSLIMMETTKFGEGRVSIILGQKPGSQPLTAKDIDEIEKAFKQSLKKFNEAEPGFKAQTFYRTGVIHRAD